MTGYEVLNVGAPQEWRSFFGGFRPETSRDGRRVVDKEMDLQYMGLTVNSLVAGEEAPYWHKHSIVEELYIFIHGKGQMGLDGEAVEVTGLIITKLDGSARGGVAIVIENSLDIPIKFIGTGESAQDFAAFEPEAYIQGLLS